MIVFIVHNNAYRILRNGVLQSAPTESLVTKEGDWAERSIEELDLNGGDYELIRNQLQWFGVVFENYVGRPKTKEVQEERLSGGEPV